MTGKSAAINLILRVVVGGAFIAAAVLKIIDPTKFAKDVGNYHLLPYQMNNLVAIILPWIELVAGLCVLTVIWLKSATGVIVGLTVVFLGVIISALARGLNIECGCFGTVGGKHIGLVNLAIDSVLFVLAGVLWRRSS